MSKHGEPWSASTNERYSTLIFDSVDKSYSICSAMPETRDRIIDCVNALEGIENPAETIKQLAETLQEIVNYCTECDGEGNIETYPPYGQCEFTGAGDPVYPTESCHICGKARELLATMPDHLKEAAQ